MAEYIDREALEQFMVSRKIRGDCKFCRNYEICVAQGLNRRGSHLYCWQKIILPAADVAEVRYGEWVEKPNPWGQDGSHTYVCTYCNEQISILGNKPNYCSYCGAKMDGKDGADNV